MCFPAAIVLFKINGPASFSGRTAAFSIATRTYSSTDLRVAEQLPDRATRTNPDSLSCPRTIRNVYTCIRSSIMIYDYYPSPNLYYVHRYYRKGDLVSGFRFQDDSGTIPGVWLHGEKRPRIPGDSGFSFRVRLINQ